LPESSRIICDPIDPGVINPGLNRNILAAQLVIQ